MCTTLICTIPMVSRQVLPVSRWDMEHRSRDMNHQQLKINIEAADFDGAVDKSVQCILRYDF